MAATSLRVVRRPKGSPARRSLTAASQPVDTVRSPRTTVGQTTRADWQNEAWSYLDEEHGVGELAYVVGWVAASVSRVKMIASEVDPNTGLPTGGLTEDNNGNLNAEQQRVAEIVRAVAGGPLGQAQLLKRAAEGLYVPGEVWITVLDRGETAPDGTPVQSWFAVSRDEWRTKTNKQIEIELPDGSTHDFVPGRDRMFRVWNPRPRRAKEATSPTRACLDPLREIVRTTRKIKIADKSRLIGNGVVFLPAEMSLPAAQAPIENPDQEGAPLPVLEGVPAADQLANLIFQQAVAATEDEDSQSAVVPLLATVPGEHLGKIFHLRIGDEITETEIKKRNDAIARLAMGLNISPERLLGLSTGNHWSAWAIGDEDVQTHIKPIVETIIASINREVVEAVLEREGIDPAKYTLWYDASGLTADPDLTEEAQQARAIGAMRNEVYLRAMGLPDDSGHDLTTLEGAQAWAREAITQDPTLIRTLAPLLDGELAAIEWPEPLQPELPTADDEDTDTDADDSRDEPDTEDTAGAVVATRAEMILAERLLVSRALELAGKRRFSITDRAQKERLRGLAPHDYHRVMGPVDETDIPKLINGWDNALADHTIEMLGVDTDALRAAVKQRVRHELTRPTIDVGTDGEVVG